MNSLCDVLSVLMHIINKMVLLQTVIYFFNLILLKLKCSLVYCLIRHSYSVQSGSQLYSLMSGLRQIIQQMFPRNQILYVSK